MRIEVLLYLKTRPGESPVRDVEQLRLWWVDSLNGACSPVTRRVAKTESALPGMLLQLMTTDKTPRKAH